MTKTNISIIKNTFCSLFYLMLLNINVDNNNDTNMLLRLVLVAACGIVLVMILPRIHAARMHSLLLQLTSAVLLCSSNKNSKIITRIYYVIIIAQTGFYFNTWKVLLFQCSDFKQMKTLSGIK